jgi:hypothetical protein
MLESSPHHTRLKPHLIGRISEESRAQGVYLYFSTRLTRFPYRRSAELNLFTTHTDRCCQLKIISNHYFCVLPRPALRRSMLDRKEVARIKCQFPVLVHFVAASTYLFLTFPRGLQG